MGRQHPREEKMDEEGKTEGLVVVEVDTMEGPLVEGEVVRWEPLGVDMEEVSQIKSILKTQLDMTSLNSGHGMGFGGGSAWCFQRFLGQSILRAGGWIWVFVVLAWHGFI